MLRHQNRLTADRVFISREDTNQTQGNARVGRFGRAALYFLAFVAISAGAQTPAIRFAEPVRLSLKDSTTQFDAYGRRFSLTLEDNERVLQKLPSADRATLQGYRLLRGSLEGAPGSWVRLTETPRGLEGAIWDGHEFYAVTRYENIATS